MSDLPTGTVTLLFTDIEGSTRLLQKLGERYATVLAECRHLLRAAFAQYDGHEVDTQGDAFFVAFARATDAISAAVTIQRTMNEHAWPMDATVRVRIGLHTGEPLLSADGYIGVDVHHAARIMSAGHGGQILLSQTTRQLVEQHLPEDTFLLDLGEHRLKDLQRPSHLFQLSIAGLPDTFPPLKTLDTRPNNLPIQPTPFIGREKEVAAVTRLLRRPEVRLVTLTGPGGVGKTRLGLHVVAELSDDFMDGVFMVALAPVSQPSQVLTAIAQTLAIGEASDQPLFPLLVAALKEKQVLLLLDNFEQVAGAAVVVAELLAACPKLKVLVTSRGGLHVRAEHEFTVPPLSLPDLKRLPNLSTLAQYEAVALFIERALATKPDFSVTNANAPAVAAICSRLDGLPLAIELAAARVKYFPLQTLLSRLEHGLSVLSGGARDLPARQQTLRGAIAWSYDLLEPAEQHLFRHLAIFVDGWSWEAAGELCMGDTGDRGDRGADELEGDILERLASLVDKSLVRQEQDAEGNVRFWMLQTLREFGLERLSSSGELEKACEAHAGYYLRLAEEAEPYLRGSGQVIWLDRLEQEHENVRTALSWLLEHAQAGAGEGKQQAEQTLRMCAALCWFWYVRGYIREGQAFLEQALALRGGVTASVRAKALQAAGELMFFLDDYPRVEMLVGESLEIYRGLADTKGIANALDMLGVVSWARSNFAEAHARLVEATALFQTVGDSWKRGRCLTQLARIATVQGRYDQARTLLEESLALYRPLGEQERIGWVLYLLAQVFFVSKADLAQAFALTEQSLTHLKQVGHKPFIAIVLFLLGQIYLAQGEPGRARELAEESVALLRELGDRGATSEALIGLARVRAYQGDLAVAEQLYRESIAFLQEIHDKEFIPSCLEGLAAAKAGQGDLLWAAHLWGRAGLQREAIGTPIPSIYLAEYQRAVADARSQLGNQAFARAWSQGRTMTLEEVLSAGAAGNNTQPIQPAQPAVLTPVTQALPADMGTASAQQEASPASLKIDVYPDELTAREVEVLRLLAQGWTDARIAEHLIISVRTVNTHVTSIYRKIQVTTRAAATRYALEHHLI
ncbi:MAG: tetratricopeptide repeat protein [Ktedonobacteraceae bacterium]